MKNRLKETGPLALAGAEAFVLPAECASALRSVALVGALYLMDNHYCGKTGCADCAPNLELLATMLGAIGCGGADAFAAVTRQGGVTTIDVKQADQLSDGLKRMLRRLSKDGYNVQGI